MSLELLVLCSVLAAAPVPAKLQGPAPLPPQEAASGWSHAPYNDGDCSLCHERKDAKNPGRIIMPVNELCYSCHEEMKDMMSSRSRQHPPAKKDCTACHNAHNSREKKLLLADLTTLCFSCHEQVKQDAAGSKVTHRPVTDGAKCMNCHNPHASNVQALLVRLPYDLCVSCHDKDDLKDETGKPLANIKKVIDGGQVKHGPVANKDCSACHQPHGGPNFRLLVNEYPAEFYASFDPENYALCFECHKADMVKEKETTTLTRFRDGSRNLHYVHVNKEGRGRTCRACHEVHAAHQPHIIRDAVPFGPRNWMLPVNFTPKENGGECTKTCHGPKSYVNKIAAKPAVGSK